MERITGSEALGLFEAYSAVYAPQELTEEQVWEEVETWVNSLIEEGHDLSEYTWEEMYEAYLEEIPGVPTSMIPQRSQPQPQGANTRKPISNAPYVSPFARPRNAGTPTVVRGGGSVPTTIRPKIGSLDPNYKSTALSAPAAGQRVAGKVGGGNAGASVQPVNKKPLVPDTKPATASLKPTTPARATAAPKVSPAPNPSLAAASSALSGTGALAAKPKPQSDIGAMITRSQQRQAAQAPKPAPAPAPARPMGGGRERMLRQSFDVFDVIKGHLLDEGFASDEKSAEAIMGAMSEAWVESICESLIGDFESKQRQQSGYKGPAGSVKTTPGYKSPIETRNDIKPETRHLFLQAKNKSSNGTQTA